MINAATDDELEHMRIMNDIAEVQQEFSGTGVLTLVASTISEGPPYTLEQKVSAARYRTEAVYNYWADLLILAAREQGLPEPSFDPFVRGPYDSVVLADGKIMSDLTLGQALPRQTFQPLSRPARIVPSEALTYSSVMPEYLERVERDTPLEDTKRKKKRWAKQFLDVMGDLEITDIKPKHAYDYLDRILAENPNRSNKTLRDYIWGVQDLLKYCVQRDYIQSNPFRDLDLKPYGEQSEQTYTFEMSELRAIFAHDWNPQDRLLLSILATTGMRPSETGNLTWERFDDTEHEGIRYFTTLDTAD